MTSLGLHDGAAWGYLYPGNASAVEHDEPIAVPAAKHTGVLSERGDDMLDDLAFIGDLWFLVGDVHSVPSDEPYAQHYGGHG